VHQKVYAVLTEGTQFFVIDQNTKHLLTKVMNTAPLASSTSPTTTLTLGDTTNPTTTVVVDNALTHPVLFDGQSTGKQYTANYDIGVNSNPRQLGIVFGRYVTWDNQASGSLENGCALVILNQGWNGNLGITDGRYEIYNLPAFGEIKDWMRKLGNERAAEQAAHYGCGNRDFDKGEITIWDSTMPSPPNAFLPGPNGSVSATGNLSGANTVISMTVSECQAAYTKAINTFNTPAITTNDQALAALKRLGVTYDQIDVARLGVENGQVVNVQIASATNLYVPATMGFATDATADKLTQGAFKSVDLGDGNSLNSDVRLSGGFGGVIWISVQNWAQFCGPDSQINSQVAPAAAASNEPILTGVGQSKDFAAGSSVVAYKIELSDGTVLTPEGCYAKDLKQGGTATDGVINPVPAQYEGAPVCTNMP
jgi:hypothetical protein